MIRGHQVCRHPRESGGPGPALVISAPPDFRFRGNDGLCVGAHGNFRSDT